MNNTAVKIPKSKRVWFGVAVFLLAVSVRLAYLHDSMDNPTFFAPIVDSVTYDELAREFVEGEGVTKGFFWQQFFYPFFLSVVYFLSNSSILFAKLIQLLLGSVTCVLIFKLGERIFGRAAGVLAGCIAAIYGPMIFFECELLAAGFATFWAVVLLLLFVKAAEKEGAVPGIALGLCGALSVITRPNFILFFAVSCVWLVAVWIRRRIGTNKLATGLVGIAGGFLIAAIPVAVANYSITGRFSIMPATGGVNLYIGNNPDFEAVNLRPGIEWQKTVELPAEHGFYTTDEQQQFFYDKTIEHMRTQPADFLKGLVRKSLQFLSSREIPGNVDVYLFTKWSRLLGLLVWKVGKFGFPFGVVLPFLILGLILCWRKIPIPLLVFCVLYPATVILTHVEARYRIPMIVPMCILAGAALVRIIEMVRNKHWQKVAVVSVLGVVIAFLCSMPGPFYSEHKINYEAELYYGLGGSLDRRGKAADALEAYTKAIALRNDYVEAHHNMGLLLMKQKRFEEAFAHYDTALELDPENSNVHKDSGMGLFMQGKVEDAIKHYYKAIEINPRNAGAHGYLGLALQKQGKLDEAIGHFLRSVQIEPDNAETHYNFGITLQLKGKLSEAAKQYQEALQIEPDFVNAHSNLGVIFAGEGKFDKAIASFKEVLKIKPDSVEVILNLAKTFQSAGKFDEAEIYYHKALALAAEQKNNKLIEKIKQELELNYKRQQ